MFQTYSLYSSYSSPHKHNIITGIPLETIQSNRKQNSEQSASITTSHLPNGEYYADSLHLESFDIVGFSTDLDSICVMGGNSLSFRHSVTKNTESTSSSTRWVGSTITKSVGALQGTIVSDFNSGGSLLCSNTTFAKCTATATVKRDAIVHKSFSVFFSNYFKSFRPEFRFEDTHFSGQKQHKFTSLRHYQNTFPVDPFAIFATSASPIIFSHCSFSDLVKDPDDADSSKGLAILLRTPAPLTVTSCTFTDIHSERSGAAICSETVFDNLLATLVIENSTFTRCQAAGDGGAMFYQYEGLISITSSSFLENSCSGSGGACFSYGCDYSFCRFEGNSANRGGAIFGTERTSIRFCHFKNTKRGGDWSSWSPIEMAFGCTRSEDWTESLEIVVSESGDGEEQGVPNVPIFL
ncbi:hypothetical protein BLNAU_5010 [Blattamonas nauphoetae]|uniref:Right handed beta helix domain-containing protein n=1 Tax=Blattamonas nauphoetae TaxID=2049346 RepID=A0ABQ9Y8S7_9EUKA|nr:hypothetical protein BLNAU_5010 [Blattamonas nauphoetae]